MSHLRLVVVFFLTLLSISVYAAPANFSHAKSLLKQKVYFDQNAGGALGTTYCGCDWIWVGRSGGRVDHTSCGYVVRAQQTRAARTEWEHITTMYSIGHQRQCWKNGGRKNCNATDPVFNVIEADMHNLTPIIGEVNADRSNYRMGMVSNEHNGMYGQCTSKTDFKQRVFEPRDEAKGMVARAHFYIADRYNLKNLMSTQQQKIFMVWDKQFPVGEWELKRNSRIATVMGHANEFVTGKKVWKLGHRNSGKGVVETFDRSAAKAPVKQVRYASEDGIGNAPIRGNRSSKIFHPERCSTYNAMSPHNIVNFNNEAEAVKAGYRKAKNCR